MLKAGLSYAEKKPSLAHVRTTTLPSKRDQHCTARTDSGTMLFSRGAGWGRQLVFTVSTILGRSEANGVRLGHVSSLALLVRPSRIPHRFPTRPSRAQIIKDSSQC